MSGRRVKNKAKTLAARVLIKLGKLKHVDYTARDLLALIEPHLPQTLDIDVPYGKGQLVIENASLSFNELKNSIQIQLFSGFKIETVNNPIYRAHVIITLAAVPEYDRDTSCVRFKTLDVEQLHLVEDEYSLVKDSRDVLALLVPHSVQNLVAGTVKSAMGFLTSGVSDATLDYLKLYTDGSKQRILDYHTPQLRQRLQTIKADPNSQYVLNPDDWEENLFIKYGSHVLVTDTCLRFHLTRTRTK